MYNSSDMEKYEHVKKFEIKYCEADFKDELKISSTLSFLEETAGSSADELGFGYQSLKPKNITFMLSALCCEFYEPIMQGDNIAVKTWPLPASYVIFGREYEIWSQDFEKKFCSATSRWCLVDLTTGRLLQSKELGGQDYSTYNTDRALDWKNWKIAPFNFSDGDLKYSLTIANSEYDHNMHVNNARYADYCLNCFSISELKEKTLKRFQISYCKQCKEGDELRFYRKDDDKGDSTVCGVNQNGEIVVLTKFLFVDRSQI